MRGRSTKDLPRDVFVVLAGWSHNIAVSSEMGVADTHRLHLCQRPGVRGFFWLFRD